MRPATVLQTLQWMKRDNRFQTSTLLKLFDLAYFYQHRELNDMRIIQDARRMRQEGYVPSYVTHFLRERVYPKMLIVNNDQKVK